jgi:hypothetical protein
LEAFVLSTINLNAVAMKKNIFVLVLIFITIGLTHKSVAQTTAAIASTNVQAKLIVPLSIEETSSLHFGTINVLGGEAGTVILPADSTERIFSGVVGSAVAPLASNAAYTVSGTKNVSYGVSLPASITVIESGGDAMTITNLKARFNATTEDGTTSTLNVNGTDSFKLGGTLTIAPNQIPGIYTGSFNISVDYN